MSIILGFMTAVFIGGVIVIWRSIAELVERSKQTGIEIKWIGSNLILLTKMIREISDGRMEELQKISGVITDIYKIETESMKKLLGTVKDIEKEEKILDKTSETTFVEEKKKIPQIKSISYYNSKIEEFMREKRRTLDSDMKICNRINLSTKALKTYIGKYKDEKTSLSAQCKANSTEELKERFYNRTRVGKGKKCSS